MGGTGFSARLSTTVSMNRTDHHSVRMNVCRLRGEPLSKARRAGGRVGKFSPLRSTRVRRLVQDSLDQRGLRQGDYARLRVVEGTDGPKDHTV